MVLLAVLFVTITSFVAVSVTKRTLPSRAAPPQANSRCRAWLSCLGFVGVVSTATSVGTNSNTVEQSVRKTASASKKTNSLATLRILINYMFMTSLLTAFQLDWGETVRWLFGFESAVSGGMPPLLGCLGFGFLGQAWLMLVSPLLLAVLLALAVSVWCVFAWRCRSGKLELWGAAPLEVLRNALMAVSFMLWPSFVGHVLRVLDCSVEVGGTPYLASDLSVSCDDPLYRTTATVATVYLHTLVPLFPVGLFVLLHRSQRHLRELSGSGNVLAQEDSKRFHQRYSFLFAGYTSRAWRWEPQLHGRYPIVQLLLACTGSVETRLFVWWECVVMTRKALLVGVTVWFARDPKFQIYAGLWVLLFAFVLQVLCQPYSDPTTGFLETLSLGATLATLLLGQALALGGLGDAAENLVRTLAALINIAMLCYFARHAVRGALADKEPTRAPTGLGSSSIANPMMSTVGTALPGQRRTSWIRAANPGETVVATAEQKF
jgi:hypothetical protein